MDLLDMIMKWLVAPVGAFAWYLHTKQQDFHTRVTVLEHAVDNNKQNHDREMSETKEYLRGIMQKLDSIETFLRK